MVQVAARGDLRHHPAIGPMLLELGEDCLAQDAALGIDERRRRLIATRLQPQHDHGRGH